MLNKHHKSLTAVSEVKHIPSSIARYMRLLFLSKGRCLLFLLNTVLLFYVCALEQGIFISEATLDTSSMYYAN